MNNIYINLSIVLGVVVALIILWLFVRKAIDMLDNRLNFLDLMTPGEVALLVVAIGTVLFGIAALMTWGDEMSGVPR